MVPIVIQDMARTISETKNSLERDNVLQRVEAIREFCEEVISQTSKSPYSISIKKKK
jgi:hypothetical protein